jgi:flagellin
MRLDDIGSIASATSVDLGTLITEATDAVAAVPTTSGAATGVATDWVSDSDGQNFTLTIDGTEILNVTQGGGTPETIDAARLDTAIASFVSGSSGAYSQTGTLAGGDLVISKADGTDMVIALSSDFGTAGSFDEAGFVGTQTDGTEAVAAVPASPFTLSDLTLQIGDADPVTVEAGDYDTAQGLVDAVNAALGGEGVASLNDDGTMSIISQSTITVGGADAGTVFADTEYAASGSLTDVNVLTVDAANDAIYRMDSALTSVSDLRSTFGAVQNRFESTITNLATTMENLSASRSRIRDADFAAETAELTRAQILQQAGISVLAQANAVPQSVLALLQ